MSLNTSVVLEGMHSVTVVLTEYFNIYSKSYNARICRVNSKILIFIQFKENNFSYSSKTIYMPASFV